MRAYGLDYPPPPRTEHRYRPVEMSWHKRRTRFRLSAKRMSPFKSAGGASVQSTTGKPRCAHQR